MHSRVRVGIMGAGSIGCFLGGRLALDETLDLVFIGRERVGKEIAEHGLTLRDIDDRMLRIPPDQLNFSTDVASLRGCRVVLCCVKSAHTESTAASLAEVIDSDTVVVSMQNGLRNAETLRAKLGKDRVLAGIVEFNVVSKGGGLFQRTTSGPLNIQACDDPSWQTVVRAFRKSGVALHELVDIESAQWTKLLINLNNAISALSGAPTRDLILRPLYRRAVAAVLGEGVQVLRKAGIRPAKLKGLPVGWMPKLLSLPTPIVRLVTRAQMKIDPEARSSMWEDLQRARLTEVDYLNGEIVRLAERVGVDAPVNRRIVERVHQAEAAAQGSPNLGGAELWAALRGPGPY